MGRNRRESFDDEEIVSLFGTTAFIIIVCAVVLLCLLVSHKAYAETCIGSENRVVCNYDNGTNKTCVRNEGTGSVVCSEPPRESQE